jgi:peptidoglycan/LPS O-acetylase OafA/YrhL
MIESISLPNRRERLAELDALRGLAMLVILFAYLSHDASALGRHGIELFFAISGFVIYVTLEGTATLGDFAISRLSRLFPAYWAAILLTTALRAASGGAFPTRQVMLVNLTMLQDFAGVPAIDPAYWTLAVELSFYTLSAAFWRLGLFRRIDRMLMLWLLLPWIWRFSPLITGYQPSPWLGLLLVQAHIPDFAIGIAAYRLRRDSDAPASWTMLALALVTIALCRGGAALVPALAITAAMLLVALRGTTVLRFPPLVRLGGISYSLYLLHRGIGDIIRAGLADRGLTPLAAALVAIGVVTLLAILVTNRIERPARAWMMRRLRRDRRRRASCLPAALPSA